MNAAAEALRANILARYRSIHAFCREHPALNRATVYQLLAGVYPGDAAKQCERVCAALNNRPEATFTVPEEAVVTVLQQCKCTHCRRPNKRGCRGCRTQTEREASLIVSMFQLHVE